MSDPKNSIDIHSEEVIKLIFDTTAKFLTDMPDGERTTMRDIVDKVVAASQAKVSIVNGLVPMFCRNFDGVVVDRGAHGGVFKGVRPLKVDMRPRCETCGQVIKLKIADSTPHQDNQI